MYGYSYQERLPENNINTSIRCYLLNICLLLNANLVKRHFDFYVCSF